MSSQRKNQMTLIGVGLKFALISIVFAAVVFAVHFLWTPHLSIPISRFFSLSIGILLMTIGIPIYLISGLTIHKYFNQGKLATNGIYAYFRHPLYGSWIVFILPGIVFTMNSLLALTIPVFMYLVFKMLIVSEDSYLEERFGEEFYEYKKRVGEIFPKFLKFSRSKGITSKS